MRAFVDTNILLYAASGLPADRAKAARARALLATIDAAISMQVLQEFFTNAVRPKKLGLSPAQAAGFCEKWMAFQVVPMTRDAFIRTLRISARFGISQWDAAIVASAQEGACARLYSEDLADGQDYDGVIVENPFRRSA